MPPEAPGGEAASWPQSVPWTRGHSRSLSAALQRLAAPRHLRAAGGTGMFWLPLARGMGGLGASQACPRARPRLRPSYQGLSARLRPPQSHAAPGPPTGLPAGLGVAVLWGLLSGTLGRGEVLEEGDLRLSWRTPGAETSVYLWPDTSYGGGDSGPSSPSLGSPRGGQEQEGSRQPGGLGQPLRLTGTFWNWMVPGGTCPACNPTRPSPGSW